MARKSDRIIIAGQDFIVPGAPNGVVTWREDSFFDFKRHGDELFLIEARQTYGKRRDPDGNPVSDIEGLKKTVKSAVLHYDVTSNSKGCATVLKSRGLSTHFMIDFDGTIYQGLDVMYQALHAGGVNARSIGIDLNNLASNLVRNRFGSSYPGKKSPEHKREKSRPLVINDVRFQCYGYTDAQYDALIALMKVLHQQLDLPIQVPVEESGEIKLNLLDKPNSFEGILAHWHASATKLDPGPGFDWQRMLSGILGGANSFPVALKGVKGLVELSRCSKQVREQNLWKVYDNTESSSVGGTYPVGHHMNWHGGVHLYVAPNDPVSAMVDGELVLAHFAKEPTSYGSNNFIVLRHEIELPAKAEEEPKKLKFYSLYMHLAPIDFSVSPGSKEARELPEWAQFVLAKETDGKGTKSTSDGENDEQDDEVAVKRSVALRFGRDGLKSLKRGEVTFFKDIKVSAGKVIGHTGDVGSEGERESFVQVEVFTDDTWKTAVGSGGHRRHFTFFSEDMDRSLRVRAPGVLSMLSGEYVGYTDGVSDISLTSFDIEEFYSDESNMTARKLFRRSVTRHVSEWSDQVDWFQALVDVEGEDPPDGWAKVRNRLQRVMGKRGPLRAQSAFADVLNQTVPFIWLTEEVAEHLGLKQKPWKGVLYHFHPVHFLLWLTFYVGRKERVISEGVSRKERKRRRRAYLEKRKLGKEDGEHDHGEDEYLSILELEQGESADEVLMDLRELEIPGTWNDQNKED